MKTSEEPSGTSITVKKKKNGNFSRLLEILGCQECQKPPKTAKNSQIQPNGLFSMETAVLKHLFPRLWERLKVFSTTDISGYHMVFEALCALVY